jgi:hypothetical protein
MIRVPEGRHLKHRIEQRASNRPTCMIPLLYDRQEGSRIEHDLQTFADFASTVVRRVLLIVPVF